MEYLTIAEFAEKAGVSKQAIYQRIKKGGLSEYLNTENGTAKISESALSLFNQAKSVEQTPEPHCDTPETHERQINENAEYLPTEELNSLQTALSALQTVIDRQAEEIRQKNEMLNERDAQISEYAAKFAELAHNALQTAVQAQTLHAVSESEKFTSKAQSEPQNATNESETAERKKNWLVSLFKWKK